jgi:hypothetical protein
MRSNDPTANKLHEGLDCKKLERRRTESVFDVSCRRRGAFMPDDQPDNLVLHLLREMRSEITDMRQNMATKHDIAELRSEFRSEMHSLRADVASDIHRLDAKIDTTRKDLSDQIVGLRRAVVEYHSAVVGHGVIIADLEARMRRVEQRLGLESAS